MEIMPNYLLQNPDDARAKMFYADDARSKLGRKEEAIAEGAAALELAPGDSLMLYNVACLYAQLGEKKKAIATLRDAIAAGVTNFQWMIRDPDSDLPARRSGVRRTVEGSLAQLGTSWKGSSIQVGALLHGP